MDKVKKYLPLVATISGILAVVLFLFMDVFAGAGVAGNGLETTFGKKQDVFGFKVTIFKFNFMGFVTILLALAAVIVSALANKKQNKVAIIVGAALFFVAAIFFFCTKSFVLSANNVDKAIADAYKNAGGAILAGILSIVGAVATATPIVLEKLGK